MKIGINYEPNDTEKAQIVREFELASALPRDRSLAVETHVERIEAASILGGTEWPEQARIRWNRPSKGVQRSQSICSLCTEVPTDLVKERRFDERVYADSEGLDIGYRFLGCA